MGDEEEDDDDDDDDDDEDDDDDDDEDDEDDDDDDDDEDDDDDDEDDDEDDDDDDDDDMDDDQENDAYIDGVLDYADGENDEYGGMMEPNMMDESDPNMGDEMILDDQYEYGDDINEEEGIPVDDNEVDYYGDYNNKEQQQDEEYVDDYGAVDDVYDVGGGEEYTPRPKFARSELVLGGDNSNNPIIASLSTISDVIYGPSNIIGDYLNANKAQCYDLVQNTQDNDAYIEDQEEYQEQNDSLGEQKDCKTDSFDVAFYDCSKDSNGEKFIPFEFESKGNGVDEKQKYALGFNELIEQYVEEGDNGGENIVCAFRMKAFDSEDSINELILGTPMFEKYYVAFNIEANVIGLAPSRLTSALAKTESGGGSSFSMESMKQYAEDNNKALVAIPIVIVIVFIIGLVIKRRRNNRDGMNAGATHSTPGTGVNYDFVDPSCREYVSNNAIGGSGANDYGGGDDGEWEGYDDRHQFT